MQYKRRNKGVCSEQTTVTLEDGVIKYVSVLGGCDGNLKGVCTLLEGRTPQEVIPLLKSIDCRGRGTSCPAQIALCLQEAMAK